MKEDENLIRCKTIVKTNDAKLAKTVSLARKRLFHDFYKKTIRTRLKNVNVGFAGWVLHLAVFFYL